MVSRVSLKSAFGEADHPLLSVPPLSRSIHVFTSQIASSLSGIPEASDRLCERSRSTPAIRCPIIRKRAGEKGAWRHPAHVRVLIRSQEFAQLTPENIVFKQIGPVLVKQEQAEAKTNVETRLDFIRGEMSGFMSTLLFAAAQRHLQKTRRRTTEGNSSKNRNQKERGQPPILPPRVPPTSNLRTDSVRDQCQIVEIQSALQQQQIQPTPPAPSLTA